MKAPLFGRIDYLNLLPFSLLAKSLPNEALKASMKYHRGVPSFINRRFMRRQINAAFVSSIVSARYFGVKLGIVAKKEVRSVLVCEGENRPDAASQTSNLLARLMGVSGEVMIGDRALRHYYLGGGGIDLAKMWYEQTGLPFVFARLCTHGHRDYFRALANKASRAPIRIPARILKQEADKIGLHRRDLVAYLRLISFTIDAKAQRGLTLFLRRARLDPIGRRRL
ncbi:MAG: hypothetical protein K6347_07575 [Campylobacterales bacterium]